MEIKIKYPKVEERKEEEEEELGETYMLYLLRHAYLLPSIDFGITSKWAMTPASSVQ